jgi:hypothetical protein
MGCEWTASTPGPLTPGQRAHVTHWIGGWLDPKSCLVSAEERQLLALLGLELRPFRTQLEASRYTDCAIKMKMKLVDIK